MTAEQLIAEGRKLQRPCVFLRPQGQGEPAAIWHNDEDNDDDVELTGYRPWLTVDARQIPGVRSSLVGFLTIFTNERTCEGGRVEVSPTWPQQNGIPLYAHPASVLPPIEAVFLHGSEAVGKWLQDNEWQRDWGYNGNFKDKAVASAYLNVFSDEYPVYLEGDIYAMLGGWHFQFPDTEWEKLVDDQLLALTIRHSEPWVETWLTKSGELKVVQRIT